MFFVIGFLTTSYVSFKPDGTKVAKNEGEVVFQSLLQLGRHVMMVRFHRIPGSSILQDLVEFERGIDELFGDLSPGDRQSPRRAFPSLDISEHENGLEIVAELPGLSKEEVKISIQERALTISGERKANNVPDDSSRLRGEIRAGKFSRTISLPYEVQMEGVSAELTNGILRVQLPKAESARPREIQVK